MPTWATPRQVAQYATGNGSGDSISHFMARETFSLNQTAGDTAIESSSQGIFTTLIDPAVGGDIIDGDCSYIAAAGDTPVTTASTGFPGNARLYQPYVTLDGQSLINHPTSYGAQIDASNITIIRCKIDNNKTRNIHIKAAVSVTDISITFSDILNSSGLNIVYFGDLSVCVLRRLTIDNCNIKFGGAEGVRISNEGFNVNKLIHETVFTNNVVEGNKNDGFNLRVNNDNTQWATFWGDGLICTGNDIFDNFDQRNSTYTSVTDAGGGNITFNGLVNNVPLNGNIIYITGTTYPAKGYKVKAVTATSFTVTETFAGTDTGSAYFYDGPGNAMLINGIRHSEAFPAWVDSNFCHNNTVGGGQYQTMGCWDMRVSNNQAWTSLAHNDIDAVGYFIDQTDEFCLFDHNFSWDIPGLPEVINSGSAYAFWNCRFCAVTFGISSDTRDGVTIGHANEIDNYYYFNTHYNLNNTLEPSNGIKRLGGQAIGPTAIHALANIFDGADFGIDCGVNQTDVKYNCFNNMAVKQLMISLY